MNSSVYTIYIHDNQNFVSFAVEFPKVREKAIKEIIHTHFKGEEIEARKVRGNMRRILIESGKIWTPSDVRSLYYNFHELMEKRL